MQYIPGIQQNHNWINTIFLFITIYCFFMTWKGVFENVCMHCPIKIYISILFNHLCVWIYM